MIYNRFWKREFISIRRRLNFWIVVSKVFDCQFVKNNISKLLFYSSSAVRAIAETEKMESKDLVELQNKGYYQWVHPNNKIFEKQVEIYIRENASDLQNTTLKKSWLIYQQFATRLYIDVIGHCGTTINIKEFMGLWQRQQREILSIMFPLKRG